MNFLRVICELYEKVYASFISEGLLIITIVACILHDYKYKCMHMHEINAKNC